jgi:rhomboid protease GluP
MGKNKNIGAIICPSCQKLINANAEKCMHCGYKNPGKRGLGSIIPYLFGGNAGFIHIVSIVCAAFYVFSIIIDPSGILKGSGILNFLSPSIESLDKLGMTGSYAMSQGRWWTMITAIYLHGSLLHIFFNVLCIRNLGPIVEELFGTARLILIFTISGVLGFLISNLLGIPFTVGASGSVYGLVGTLIFYGRNRGGVFGQAIFRQLMIWVVFFFILGFTMSGINNYAHAGGFVGGYLSGKLFGYHEKKKETPFHKNLAGAAIIVTIISFLLAFWTGLSG